MNTLKKKKEKRKPEAPNDITRARPNHETGLNNVFLNIFERLNIALPHDPAISLRKHIPKRSQNICAHRNLHRNVHSRDKATFISNRLSKWWPVARGTLQRLHRKVLKRFC